ncbi:hypothetical protein I551_8512 [Mycobacterium ulcerans str. Harvey]|uniref:Uncharacterized protein n=1 Tax=Mycobacterium ulcerans str. Harvey TaxID=1299332 RepID=A0ABN0RAQ1_MYCUL|nr:hypothetical protein I551_8512 [Mycobacterium ulcerans str. Harvey]
MTLTQAIVYPALRTSICVRRSNVPSMFPLAGWWGALRST